MIIGLTGAAAWPDAWSCSGAWPDAGVWPSAANPPANVAPPFRSSLRLVRFEPIGLSFEIDPIGLSLENDPTTKPCLGGREYTQPCQIWPVRLRILKRQLGSPSSCRVASH